MNEQKIRNTVSMSSLWLVLYNKAELASWLKERLVYKWLIINLLQKKKTLCESKMIKWQRLQENESIRD